MKKLSLFLIFFIFFSSCNNQKEKTRLNKDLEKDLSFKIQFSKLSKSVFINQEIEGTLFFDRSLDSSLISRLSDRYTFLYVTTDTLAKLNAENIQQKNHNAYIDKSGSGTYSFKFKFSKPGAQSIYFVIEDILLLKPKDSSYSLGVKKFEYATEKTVIVNN